MPTPLAMDPTLITPEQGQDWTSLMRPELLDIVKLQGYVLARGFDIDTDRFNQIVESHSARMTLDPARVFQGGSAQLVDSGHEEMGLHLENGATPYAPDLLWFCCLRAASEGSQTTICDGQKVWLELSPEAQEAFSSKSVRYTRFVRTEMWRKMAAYLTGKDDPADATVQDLHDTCRPGTSVDLELTEDGLIYKYDVRMAGPTRWSTTMAWASSLLGPSYNYDAPTITFDDGSEIPDHLIEECRRATAAVTEEIAWEAGDIVAIDNSRVMHGRRAISDPNRRILNAQTILETK